MKLENTFTIDAPVEKAWEALNSPETVAPCFPGATLTTYEGDSFTGTVKVKLGPIAMTYKGKGTYVSRDDAAHEVVIDASGRDSRGNGTASAKVTASLTADGPEKTAVTMVTDMTITGKPAQFGRGVISDVADKIITQFSACVARKLADGETAPEGTGTETTAEPVPAAAAGAASTNGVVAAPTSAPATTDVPSTAPIGATTSEASAGGGAAVAAAVASGPAPSVPATPKGTPSAVSASAPPATATAAAPASTPRAPVRSEVDAIDLLDTAGAPVLRRAAPVAGGAVLLLLLVLLVRRLRAR